MDKRKALILNTIIKEHIKTGAPVGSSVLVDKYKLKVSPATVRNDMAALEEEGYIIQPHTSAGRVPTELAYDRYLKELSEKRIGEAEQYNLDKVLAELHESNFRESAKTLSQMTGGAVFWAFHRHNVYYTGISNLLSQPEFRELNIVYDISSVIDRIDEIVDSIFEDVGEGVHTLLGEANPFGAMCGTVLVKYKSGDNTGLFGILGPMRMNYAKNLALANYIKNKISKHEESN